MFKLPYSLLPTNALKNASSLFLGIGEFLDGIFPFLKLHIKQAKLDFSAKEYLSMCFFSSIIFFVFFWIFLHSYLIFSGGRTIHFAWLRNFFIHYFFCFSTADILSKIICKQENKGYRKEFIGCSAEYIGSA